MTYQVIDNFAAGLDTRKSPVTSPAGTLYRLLNAVITPGGEIAKRRAFIQAADLTGSIGLAATASSLYVFGANVDPPTPAIGVSGVTLKGLKVPNDEFIQTDFDIFNGRVYVAGYEPGTYRHFYQSSATPTVMVETETGTGVHKGPYVRTFQSKIYTVIGPYLAFSAIDDPMLWKPEYRTGTGGSGDEYVYHNVGAGYIVLSSQDASGESLTSLEVYYDKLAVFSNTATQIWAIDTDPAQNAFEQLLRGAGTSAQRSPLQYGSGDVLYLDPSGIRSLKARDSSNSASVSDIGSPVDPIVQAYRNNTALAGSTASAIALLEPSIGRFWMVFPKRILVLSYFPGPQITAWSEFTLNFTVAHAVTCGGKIFIRDTAHRLWVYGGPTGTSYDDCGGVGVEVRMPYLDGKKPGHKKQFGALDATVSGTWRVAISYDFNNPEAEETVATLSYPNGGATWNSGAHELTGYDSHFSLRFYNTDTLPASISNCAVHYEMGADEE